MTDFENQSWQMYIRWLENDVERLRHWWGKRDRPHLRCHLRYLLRSARANRDRCKKLYKPFKYDYNLLG